MPPGMLATVVVLGTWYWVTADETARVYYHRRVSSDLPNVIAPGNAA